MDESAPPGRPSGGLYDSVRSLIATLVAMAHTRVELFGNELEEELSRVVAQVVGSMIVLALAVLATLFISLLLVTVFWDTHRVAVVASVAVAYSVLTVIAYLLVRLRSQRTSRLLSATLGELDKDRKHLAGPGP